MSKKYFSSAKELMRHLVDGGCIRNEGWPKDTFMQLKNGQLIDSSGANRC